MNINPIDITEGLVTKMNLNFSRLGDNEISIQLKTENPEYILFVVLRSDYEIVHFSCDMNLQVPMEEHFAVTDAIAKANERMWIGHFDLMSANHSIIYNLTIPFISSFMPDEEMMEALIKLIKNDCNKFYHYFLMTIKGEKLSNISRDALFFEFTGEA